MHAHASSLGQGLRKSVKASCGKNTIKEVNQDKHINEDEWNEPLDYERRNAAYIKRGRAGLSARSCKQTPQLMEELVLAY